MWHFSGFNGFGQFGYALGNYVNRLTNFSLELPNDELLIAPAWSYNLIAVGQEILIFGLSNSNSNKKTIQKTQFPDKIIAVESTNNYSLVLLISGKLYKLVRKSLYVEEIKFKNYDDERKSKENEVPVTVERIACGSRIAIVITTNNSVYNIPNKIIQFPNSNKIIDIQCGFEHAVALNSHGDVYTWGNGLRGQLGIDELKIQETPTLITALGGIKIISIAAGGWHSAAASLFGDVYIWGLNCSGQLGMRLFNSENGLKNSTVYPIPQLVDLPECLECENLNKSCNVIAVYCGSRHTVIRTSCGSILSAGWNKYGQLGLADDRLIVDKFEKMSNVLKNNVNLLCGPWCTIFKLNL